MQGVLKNNGLSIVLLSLFVVTLAGQYVTGWLDHNEDLLAHGKAEVSFVNYASSGHFIEAVFENWESEFLQMAAFVIFTVFLFQKGSAESKPPDKSERVDTIKPGSKNDPKMPWPVRRGGTALKLYSYSLSIALLGLFLISLLLHAIGGASEYNVAQSEHGQPTVGILGYMATSRFWFESFQNWQSEFLSIAVMVIFTIFLRQKGSPESKPVDTPHSETGSE